MLKRPAVGNSPVFYNHGVDAPCEIAVFLIKVKIGKMSNQIHNANHNLCTVSPQTSYRQPTATELVAV